MSNWLICGYAVAAIVVCIVISVKVLVPAL
jgi:hypothetical protein